MVAKLGGCWAPSAAGIKEINVPLPALNSRFHRSWRAGHKLAPGSEQACSTHLSLRFFAVFVSEREMGEVQENCLLLRLFPCHEHKIHDGIH